MRADTFVPESVLSGTGSALMLTSSVPHIYIYGSRGASSSEGPVPLPPFLGGIVERIKLTEE